MGGIISVELGVDMSGEVAAEDKSKARVALRAQQWAAYAVQLVVYVVLALAAFLPGIMGSEENGPTLQSSGLLGVVVVILMWFVLRWPFRTGKAERVIALIAGLASATFAFGSQPGGFASIVSSPADHAAFLTLINWALWVGVLLIALTVVSFGRQMARENRSHLIRALSHCMTAGVAAIAVSGWMFLPWVLTSTSAVLMTIVLLVVLAVMAYASTFWVRELDPDPAAKVPWMGAALLPVMFSGLAVFAVAFASQLLG